jgi:hypothetical protein
MKLRKIRKLFFNPGYFFRDALIRKYPISTNQNNIKFLSEEILIDNERNILSGFNPHYNIDIVYSWVDSNDNIWKKRKEYYLESNIVKTERFSTDDARFKSHNEIYYSLLSVAQFIPWVRKIFIITDDQYPEIPNSIKDKTVIVDHRDIIPKEFLPTFNSHVIEAYLHKVPNLSENFIYFNDDFFVARPQEPSHFFRSNGLCSIFTSNKSLKIMSDVGVSTATLTASNNCNRLLQATLDTSFDKPLTHTYVPLKKSMYEKAFNLFSEEIIKFSPNKFRGKNDLNLATFLVPYLQYLCGLSTPHLDISYYFNIRSPAARTFYQNLLLVKNTHNAPHSFCANDFNTHDFTGNKVYDSELVAFLEKYFVTS